MTIPRIKIKFEMPKEFETLLNSFETRLRNHILRQAIRSAVLPPRNALKAFLMSLTQSTGNFGGKRKTNYSQASGATMRALQTKIKQSRNNRNIFYGIVGVERRLIEMYADVGEGKTTKRGSTRVQLSLGVLLRRDSLGNPVFSRKYQPKEVKSSLRKRYGTKGKNVFKYQGMHFRKRKPSNYWHILERGSKNFQGYGMVQDAAQSTLSESLTIFRDRVEHFLRNPR